MIDAYWTSIPFGAVVIVSLTLLGTLGIRLVARAAERRVRAPAHIAWPGDGIIDLLPRASLRPFVAWILWAFAAGMVATLLAQRIALSAEVTTEAPGSGGVVISAVHATRVPNPPATEDRGDVEVTAAPASEELSTSQGPTLATQSSGPRDDPASSVAIASWYGPGFYGNRTACGQLMTPELQGVAHRTLACGTLVALAYGGRIVFVPVVDRGPFVAGRLWDLTAATRASLGCPDLCAVTWWLP